MCGVSLSLLNPAEKPDGLELVSDTCLITREFRENKTNVN